MAQQVASKVPFVISNVGRCACPGCPVQGKSKCVAGLKAVLKDALKKTPLKAKDIPGMYCSTGKAACTDLDSSQGCACPTCAVFTQYNLARGQHVGYYCRDGISN
jgi:hypothetical protein